jgi:hypothetical protein
MGSQAGGCASPCHNTANTINMKIRTFHFFQNLSIPVHHIIQKLLAFLVTMLCKYCEDLDIGLMSQRDGQKHHESFVDFFVLLQNDANFVLWWRRW